MIQEAGRGYSTRSWDVAEASLFSSWQIAVRAFVELPDAQVKRRTCRRRGRPLEPLVGLRFVLTFALVNIIFYFPLSVNCLKCIISNQLKKPILNHQENNELFGL